MTSKDRDFQSVGEGPDKLVLEIGKRIFDVARTPTGRIVAKVRREIDQSTAVIPSIAEPSNILPSPQKIASPNPLREEDGIAMPPRRRNSSERDRSTGEIQHRPARGRQRLQLSRWVLSGAAAILTLGSIYAAREPLSEAVDYLMNNQPGQQAARKSYSEHKSYINIEEQLNAQREAAKVDSGAIRVALDKQQIRDQIKFLQDFARDVDQRNNNPHAGDSHRQEAARLQALLDK